MLRRIPADALNDPPAQLPSQGLRTTVSFFLFVHLFALMVAVVSNARPVSAFRRQLREVPLMRPYLRWLHMDLAYNYHLTYGPEFDANDRVEIELDTTVESSPPATKLFFPDQNAQPGIRQQRYRNLLLNLDTLLERDDQESILPHAIAQKLLAERGVTSGKHRLRVHRYLPVRRQDMAALDPTVRDPFDERRFETAYMADLAFHEDELILTKAAGVGETAPVERSR